jgi:hypothetical protein
MNFIINHLNHIFWMKICETPTFPISYTTQKVRCWTRLVWKRRKKHAKSVPIPHRGLIPKKSGVRSVIRYARACSTYDQFSSRDRLLTNKLMWQEFLITNFHWAIRWAKIKIDLFDVHVPWPDRFFSTFKILFFYFFLFILFFFIFWFRWK